MALRSPVGRAAAFLGRGIAGLGSVAVVHGLDWSTRRSLVPASSRRRSSWLCRMVSVIAVLLVGCLVWLQVLNPDRYLAQGAGQRTVSATLVGLRGSILDRHGEAFAMSLPAKAVVADPRHVEDSLAEAAALAPLVGMEPLAVQEILERPDTGFAYVARQLEPEQAAKIDDLRLAGITIVDESRRFNTGGQLAQSVVGRMDSVGDTARYGLEKMFNDRLAGTNGKRSYERGGDGASIVGTEQMVAPARAGESMTLTLDRNLQFLAEEVLGEQLSKLKASGGTVVIGRPQTGEMLAMANAVTTADGGHRPARQNIAVRTYEPGSVMKVVTAAAGFETGTVQPNQELMVEQNIRVADRTIRDSHSHKPELMTVNRIIAESSNVGTIKIAQMLGKDKILEYLDRFGFGTMTNLGLHKEQVGEFRRVWNGSDIGSIPIGQSVTATPVQIWSAYNAIANRGIYVAPKLIDHWTDPQGNVTPEETPAPRRVLTENAAQQVTTALQQVVEEGTGKEWAIPGFNIAAKTGTAYEVWGDGYGYRNAEGKLRYAASFVGFFPASNPQLSIMVMIDNPQTEHYGSTAAGPVFDRLAKEAMRRYGIAGDAIVSTGQPIRATPAPSPTTTSTTTTTTVADGSSNTVPNPSNVPVATTPVASNALPPSTAADGSVPLLDPGIDDVFAPDAPPPDALGNEALPTAQLTRDSQPLVPSNPTDSSPFGPSGSVPPTPSVPELPTLRRFGGRG